MKQATKARTTFQAGYYQGNNWLVVGRGSSIEEARRSLGLLLLLKGFHEDDIRGLRYIEDSYKERFCNDLGWIGA